MAVTLTPEDGTITAGANSYVSLAEANAYFDNRPDSDWTGATDDAKKTALIKATDYLLERFRNRWKGLRIDPTQTLDWPRREVYPEVYYDDLDYEIPSTTIPQEVKDATIVLAGKVNAGTALNPDLARGGATKREKVGDLEVEYFGRALSRTEYVAVNDRLKPLLKDTAGLSRV